MLTYRFDEEYWLDMEDRDFYFVLCKRLRVKILECIKRRKADIDGHVWIVNGHKVVLYDNDKIDVFLVDDTLVDISYNKDALLSLLIVLTGELEK